MTLSTLPNYTVTLCDLDFQNFIALNVLSHALRSLAVFIETRCVLCGTADIDFITPYQDSVPSLYMYVIMSFFSRLFLHYLE